MMSLPNVAAMLQSAEKLVLIPDMNLIQLSILCEGGSYSLHRLFIYQNVAALNEQRVY